MVKGFYNIYVNNQLLQLIQRSDLAFISLSEGQLKMDYDANPKHLMDAIEKLEGNQCKRVVLYTEHLDGLWSRFTEIFEPIAAAGGIVYNDRKEILTIYRRNFWDLPKGKIEPQEKKKEAAIREVKEECGLANVEIVNKLGNTYHTFGSKDKRKLKISTWYTMYSEDKQLTAQTEEDIEKVTWMSLKEFSQKAKPIFPNILDVVEAYSLKNQHYA